jgi:hypothetical protein
MKKDNRQRLFEIMERVAPKFNLKNTINDMGRRLSRDWIITINHQLPYISITNNPSKEELELPFQQHVPQHKKQYGSKDDHILRNAYWYAQGEDAQELIDEIPPDIKPEYYLLWYLESAGIFNK